MEANKDLVFLRTDDNGKWTCYSETAMVYGPAKIADGKVRYWTEQ